MKRRYLKRLHEVKKVLNILSATKSRKKLCRSVSCLKKDWMVKSFDKAKCMYFLIKGFAGMFLRFCFLSLKSSIYETREMFFNSFEKLLLFLRYSYLKISES